MKKKLRNIIVSTALIVSLSFAFSSVQAEVESAACFAIGGNFGSPILCGV
ncbi:hypothetical protein [Oceanobacillus halophilus]|nr:hypothetical protein [Oceanobacillus halophilus]